MLTIRFDRLGVQPGDLVLDQRSHPPAAAKAAPATNAIVATVA